MCSSISSISICLPAKTPFVSHNCFNYIFPGNPLSIGRGNPRHLSLSATIADRNTSFECTWGEVNPEDYNGWAIEEPAPKVVEKKGWRSFAIVGVGASAAAVLGLLACFSFASKGFGVKFKLISPFSAIHGHSPSLSIKDEVEIEDGKDDVPLAESHMSEETVADVTDAFVVTEKKHDRIIVPLSVDASQQEAISVLKELKIIEDDVRADELCTRREYARWLVRANSQLERNKKHRLNPFAALCGSGITAFDDIGVEDPDFDHIQTLAEAGIIRSKLSQRNPGSYLDGQEKLMKFLPERFISREDLVSWKAKIEYDVLTGTSIEIARRNIGFLDVKEISSDALLDLFVDYQADRKSITRGVFGQSRRFQPSKPCTKAQVAVALTCGRVSEFIQAEISRLEAEKVSRERELKEVMLEILERGDIKQYWEREMEKERSRGMEVDVEYRSAITALEHEKAVQEIGSAELVKQKAALECQEQLLSSLKAEVTEMSERLSLEKAEYIDELRGIQDTQHSLQAKYEGLLDAKSILETEIEALRILRCWVEEEGRKSRARAKVLEEAGRRWKWDN